MRKFIYLFVSAAFLFSCQQGENVDNESIRKGTESHYSVSDFQDAAELNLSIREYQEMKDEVKDMRRASIFMAQYISLDRKNRKYSIDISEEKAIELGIDKENYRRIVADIEALNKALVDHPDIELMDVKEQYKEFKKKEI